MWNKWSGWGGTNGEGGGQEFWVLISFHGVVGKRSPSRSRGCSRRLDDILLYGLPRGVVVYAVI